MNQPTGMRSHSQPGIVVTALAALLLAACTTTPPVPPAPAVELAPPPAPPAPGTGVVARGERLLVYRPGSGESWRSIAAQTLGSEEHEWQIAAANAGMERPLAGQPLVVPLRSANPGGVEADRYQTVPVLCYHRFGSAAGGRMTVAPARFAAQMEWLVQNGYRVVRLERLADYLAGKAALPPRAVVVTVDDGYESFYQHAYPVLRRLGLPATLFVYTDFLGSGQALGWGQLQEMAASGLVDVQSHSKTHRNLIERFASESDERYRQSLEQEIRGPRELLEKRLQTPVRHFAYPFGDANEQVLEQLARQRFTLAVTVTPGGNAFFAQPLMLRRTMIFGDYDLEAFKARIQTSRRIGTEP